LEGVDILQEARILAVADVVESMVHYRPYRAAHHLDKALAEIREDRGIKYDPDVVDACLKIMQKGFGII
jgi:HD-GYP domain-containing protein (c-di-GMP phosphodiesterase class II)